MYMSSKVTKYGVIVVAYMLFANNIYAQKKHFLIIDTTKIQNMETLKFDIENYEKNQKNDDYQYTKEDGTVIDQYTGWKCYIEKEYLPKKLYYIYREYYLNGNIQTIGFMIGTAFPIGVWKHYDEQGNMTEENMDAWFTGKFDYNKAFLFLNRKKVISIKTGKGRDELAFGFDKKTYCWVATIFPVPSNNYKGVCYWLDGNTGKVKKKEVMLASGE